MDLARRILIPVIVLQNHNRYNILEAGHEYSIDIEAIEREVRIIRLKFKMMYTLHMMVLD